MSTEMPRSGPEPRSAEALQILSAEHWSLLSTRSLTYTEALGRVNIFLTVLSGAMIALALVAQVDRFGQAFVSISIFVLLVVLFVGVATVGRLNRLNGDDFRWVLGMNRLRHGYLALHPELEPNFVTSPFDDLEGALQTLGIDGSTAGALGSPFHVYQTLPGMLSVVVAAVAAAIGALAGVGTGLAPAAVVGLAIAAFVLALVSMGFWGRRSVTRADPTLAARFPRSG
jgi:hypothetical protein